MANNSTRDILQRMSDHLEDLEGLDYEKTQPLPDDVTDLNTFMTPGIYRVEHPEDVAHGPFSDNSASGFYTVPYILVIKSKLDAAPTWCQQYAFLSSRVLIRSNANNNGVISNLNNNPWYSFIDDSASYAFLRYAGGISTIANEKASVDIETPVATWVPAIITAWTQDGSHFALYVVVSNPFGSGTSKWIIKEIADDQELSLTVKDANKLTLTRSGSLLSYQFVMYTVVRCGFLTQ